MSSMVEFRSDGTVRVSRSDGYTYIIKDGASTWRYITGGDESLEFIPDEVGLRKPFPEPSAPPATEEQLIAYNRTLSIRKIAMLDRILKERKQKIENKTFVV